MKELGRWERVAAAVAGVGLVDSVYLTLNVLFPEVTLVCPSGGIVNCGQVTSSPYSKLFGVVPVAELGLLWFAAMLILFIWRPPVFPYAVVLLWVAGLVTVGYLIFVEAVLLEKVCLYCTLAHVCTILLGIPTLKLALREI